MKKPFLTLICLAIMMVASTSLKGQELSIELNPGWTWICHPGTDTLDFATAFGSFTPAIGDLIKSKWGVATYVGNGRWRGAISQFYPGHGYRYKSNRTVPVTLTFQVQQPTPQVTVTTSTPINISTNFATCGGNVASGNENYVLILLKGICWSTYPNPTLNDNYIEAGNGLGNFTISMTDLAVSTTYYVRAFAITPTGTSYGEEVNFTTKNPVSHDYVDLGLPSGTLWATCNVGADTPEEYGDYFAWGEPHPKVTYNWSTYQYCDGNSNTLTKYCNDASYGCNGYTDILTTLLPQDDAATANWGADWRMPTIEEWEELCLNTTSTWSSQNGVNGWIFTASNGNSLFLPAGGYYNNDNLCYVDRYGRYWSSSLNTVPYTAMGFSFLSSGDYVNFYSRYYGRSVRAVRNTH